jgi:pimeloyl-ACP methyl ester carboxylesterase
MTLDYTHYGDGTPVIILHGLFGSADNWATLGKKIATSFSVYLVDQRNHGHSPHSDEFSYDLLAQDILDFMDQHEIPKAILLGHSMGGKAAMRFAQLFPERVVKLVVADMGVKEYPPHHGPIFNALHAINLSSLKSRIEAEDQMKQYLPDPGVRQFILKSLYRIDKDTFAWRMNFKVLENKMDDILKAIPVVTSTVPAFFISGSLSNYVTASDKELIIKMFPNASFTEMKAGHWLHAEDPETFLGLFMEIVTR